MQLSLEHQKQTSFGCSPTLVIDLNAKDWQGQTALDVTIKWDYVAVSEFLLTAGSFSDADGAGERSIRTSLIDAAIKAKSLLQEHYLRLEISSE